MVTTRRSAANGTATNGTSKSRNSDTTNDIIHVLVPSNSKTHSGPTTLKLASAALEPTHQSSMSEHDLSLTSPQVHDSPRKIAMSTPKQKPDPISYINSMAPSSSKPLVSNLANVSGAALNPIIVMDSSPPCRPSEAIKREQQRQSEPHKFIDRGYKKLYSYRPSRPALAPKPANGNTFTGHKSHDIYRMMNAKIAVAPTWRENETPASKNLGNPHLPFAVQYPISAQYLARHSGTLNQRQPPSVQYYGHDTRQLKERFSVPARNEEMLRKRALQYVREYSRPSPRKRRLSDADPDETSSSEPEQLTVASHSSFSKPTAHPSLTSLSSPFPFTEKTHKTKLPVFHDPNFDISQLTEHTSLLTSLLQAYPNSPDQKGLREDIAMLVSVQNQRVRTWMKSESQIARMRRKSNHTDSANSVVSHVDGNVESANLSAAMSAQQRLENEKKKQQDNEMRQIFSATANMWQDGSGQGVADVFADTRGSSVAASFDGKTSSPARKDSGGGGR
ncbi:Nn.00g008130.m01.CDS01 [Neocucurbitaria sp. VM-36]